jgi:hypothetical protein
MLSSAKMLLSYLADGNLNESQLQVLTDADYKIYQRVINAESSETQLNLASYLEFYALQVIDNLEGEAEEAEEPVQPKSVLKGRVIPLDKQSKWQRVWGDWCKKVNAENAKAIADYKTLRKTETGSANGAHLKWINIHKGKDTKEFQEFQANHPASK